jgi:hypothetical protein
MMPRERFAFRTVGREERADQLDDGEGAEDAQDVVSERP